MSKRIFQIIEFSWLLVAFITAGRKLHHYYTESLSQVNSDAQYTYLPAAKHILHNAWEFLISNPQSYTVAPLGYLWPALWGADEILIRAANSALFFCCIWLVWKTANRIGGIVAGMVATFILVKHPAIGYYIPKVLTEAIFLFGLLLFSWAVAEILAANKRSKQYFVIAGIGLTITLLSRPVFQLMVLAAIFLCALLILLWRIGTRWILTEPTLDLIRKTFVTLILAALLPMMVVIKNGISFDVWSIATGSGAGLYYGVNPMRQGIEPAFLGFEYDIAQVVSVANPESEGNPLSRIGDQIERRVAMSIVTNTELADNASFFANKAFAWVFYSTPELKFDTILRKYRLFELLIIFSALIVLVISLVREGYQGLIRIFSNIKLGFLPQGTDSQPKGMSIAYIACWLMTLGMLVQLIPILYNSRYNGFLLEPWIIFLTASSAGMLANNLRLIRSSDPATSRFKRWRLAGAWHFLTLGLVVFAFIKIHAYSERHEDVELDPVRTGPALAVLNGDSVGQLHAQKMSLDDQGFWKIEANGATLHIPFEYTPPEANFLDGIWRISLRIESSEGASDCRRANVELMDNTKNPSAKRKIPLKADGQMHTYAFVGNHPMRPTGNGTLRLSFYCPIGTRILFGGIDLLKSTMPEAARNLIQHDVGIDPYFRTYPFIRND